MKIFNFFFDSWITFILTTLNFQVFIFFLLIVSYCITAAVCVNHIDIKGDIIQRKNLFTKEKKNPKKLSPISQLDDYVHGLLVLKMVD